MLNACQLKQTRCLITGQSSHPMHILLPAPVVNCIPLDDITGSKRQQNNKRPKLQSTSFTSAFMTLANGWWFMILVPFLHPILLIPPVSFPFSVIYDPVTNTTPRINIRVTVKESGRTLKQVFLCWVNVGIYRLTFMTSWSWAVQEVNSIQFASIIGLSNVARVKCVYCNTRPLGFIRDMVVCLMMRDVWLLHDNLMLQHLCWWHSGGCAEKYLLR